MNYLIIIFLFKNFFYLFGFSASYLFYLNRGIIDDTFGNGTTINSTYSYNISPVKIPIYPRYPRWKQASAIFDESIDSTLVNINTSLGDLPKTYPSFTGLTPVNPWIKYCAKFFSLDYPSQDILFSCSGDQH